MAELVGGRRLLRDRARLAGLVRELVALADDDDRERLPARVPALDLVAALLDRDRLLGDQDHVRAAGDPAHDRDPAGVPAHHLDDHHAVVRLRGRVQPVDRLGRDRDRGVEAERVVRRREVVVDRLRHADDRELVLAVEPRRDAERVLAADRDQRVEPCRSKVSSTRSTPPSILYGFVRVVPMIVPPRGRIPEISRGPSGSTRSVDEPAPALAHGEHLVAAVERAPRHRADDGVQPGAVAPAGEDPDPPRHARTVTSGVSVEMPKVGIEPTLPGGNRILSPARLPVPPLRPPRMVRAAGADQGSSRGLNAVRLANPDG